MLAQLADDGVVSLTYVTGRRGEVPGARTNSILAFGVPEHRLLELVDAVGDRDTGPSDAEVRSIDSRLDPLADGSGAGSAVGPLLVSTAPTSAIWYRRRRDGAELRISTQAYDPRFEQLGRFLVQPPPPRPLPVGRWRSGFSARQGSLAGVGNVVRWIDGPTVVTLASEDLPLDELFVLATSTRPAPAESWSAFADRAPVLFFGAGRWAEHFPVETPVAAGRRVVLHASSSSDLRWSILFDDAATIFSVDAEAGYALGRWRSDGRLLRTVQTPGRTYVLARVEDDRVPPFPTAAPVYELHVETPAGRQSRRLQADLRPGVAAIAIDAIEPVRAWITRAGSATVIEEVEINQ